VRGQEADKWKAMVQPPLERFAEIYHPTQYETDPDGLRFQHMVNRESIRDERDFPAVQCFERTFAFFDDHRDADNWMVQLETFDPHEPFSAPARFREDYPTHYGGPILDWPRYRRLIESPEEIAELRANYAALVALCDHYLGRLLDTMEAHDLWRDPALIMTTDHGFMLSEHDWWGKNRMPFYDEIARIPLMIYHPDYAAQGGRHRAALTQTIDLMPTILELFGQPVPPEVRGRSILPLLEDDGVIRDGALYGIFGGATNVTDGRYTYFRYPKDLFDQDLYEYTLMPTHMHDFFAPAEFEGARLADPFDFTKGLPMLRLPARHDAKRPRTQGGGIEDAITVLYDTETDPGQMTPLAAPEVEHRLIDAMLTIMRAHDAPPEAYQRLDLVSSRAGRSAGAAARVDRPQIDQHVAAHAVIVVVQIHRRIAVWHLADDQRAARQGAAVRQVHPAELVAEPAIGRAFRRTGDDVRRRAVHGKALRPGIGGDEAVVVGAYHPGVHKQRAPEPPGVLRAHRHLVVLHVAEDIRADLQVGHDVQLMIEVVRAGAAAGHDLGSPAGLGQRVADPAQARDRLMRLPPALGVVLDMLDLAGITLHTAKAQRRALRDQLADLDRGRLTGDPEPVRADIGDDQN
jgi:hypothetical protein